VLAPRPRPLHHNPASEPPDGERGHHRRRRGRLLDRLPPGPSRLRDVVVLERETVGSGRPARAAGGIRVQFSTETEIRFSLERQSGLRALQEEFGVNPGYTTIGYLYLLSEERHLRGFEKRIALQRTLGADVRVITPPTRRSLSPPPRGRPDRGGLGAPGRQAGPAEVTNAFARARASSASRSSRASR